MLTITRGDTLNRSLILFLLFQHGKKMEIKLVRKAKKVRSHQMSSLKLLESHPVKGTVSQFHRLCCECWKGSQRAPSGFSSLDLQVNQP